MTVAVRLPPRKKVQTPDPTELLAWYDRHARVLPWRARRGERAEPYHVWLSEIMLQQTTVKAVGPYYARFLSRWPTVGSLAAANLDDVLRVWAGLGYYARARNLHACAKAVVDRHGGRFPEKSKRCATCRALVTIRRRQWQRLLLIFQRCRSTGMSSVLCHVYSQLRTNCRRQSPQSSDLPHQ